MLATLVLKWSDAMRARDVAETDRDVLQAAGARTPAQAMHLARDLARLIDMVETENAELSELENLVPDALSEHWQQTLEFLKIILQFWPAHLDSVGKLSPADRRNRLILGEAARLRATPPSRAADRRRRHRFDPGDHRVDPRRARAPRAPSSCPASTPRWMPPTGRGCHPTIPSIRSARSPSCCRDRR